MSILFLALLKAYLVTGFLFYVYFELSMQAGVRAAEGTPYALDKSPNTLTSWVVNTIYVIFSMVFISFTWPVMYHYYRGLSPIGFLVVITKLNEGMDFEEAIVLGKAATLKGSFDF